MTLPVINDNPTHKPIVPLHEAWQHVVQTWTTVDTVLLIVAVLSIIGMCIAIAYVICPPGYDRQASNDY